MSEPDAEIEFNLDPSDPNYQDAALELYLGSTLHPEWFSGLLASQTPEMRAEIEKMVLVGEGRYKLLEIRFRPKH